MQKDDRLILLTRLAFTPLAFLTAIFGPLLVIFPGATDVLWAWQIKPEMSAAWVGSSYTFGAFAITTMLIVGRWSASTVAVAGLWPFSLAMLAATLMHLDRFFLDSPRFYVWLIVYVSLPLLLPLIFWLNSKRDPGPRPGDMLLPPLFRKMLVAAGTPLLLLGLLLFIGPALAAEFWPWQLTPLMSRVIGGWLLFIGAGSLCSLFERRYIAYRLFLPAAAIWFAILLVASLFNYHNFVTDRPSVIIFFVVLSIAILGILGMFVVLERRYRAQPATAPAIS